MQQPDVQPSPVDQPSPERERIVADLLGAKLDAYDVTRLMVACSDPVPLGCLVMMGVPMEDRFSVIGVQGAEAQQQVREESTAADLLTMARILVVISEREERGLRMNTPVGETFSLLEISALCVHLHEIGEPGINAFLRSANLDGARINERYGAALVELPEIEKMALLVMGRAWDTTEDLEEVEQVVRAGFECSPIAEAIAERRATGTGGITMH